MTIIPLSDSPASEVESLLDRAFGPDRHGRTAYRLRSGTRQIEALSFAATDEGGSLAGTIQCWPVRFVGNDGRDVPMILVGPVAVEPSIQRGGIGQQLMAQMLAAADSSPLPETDALMLIGDPEYYGRFFGFTADATGGWRLPGPFEPRRLLARGLGVPDGQGEVRPRV
ncbi:GNAT family N-acetyltransferase [uncultured Sphingomonas sp.]|uniref:GNAT family N-acetyltransferase n=1 Tax=uncultured Sphingomonas sp. TaxID=158754 RepID=UPI0025D67490|nr:N-acetyltransferase [uncultured Sphingomonas sp.]